MSQVLLGLLSLVAAVLGSELLARWWVRFRGRYYVLPPGMRLKMIMDPDVLPQLDRTARFEVNSDGERGGEVPRSRRGLYRVLVGGGSQPEGFFLDQDATWPGALQRILERPRNLMMLGASRVHVGCVARSGVGSEGLDLIFEKTLPRYPRLQLIVIFVGASDVARWFEQDTPERPHPVRVSDTFRCHPEGPFGWRPAELALGELLRRGRRRWLRPLDVHERTGRWIGRARAMRARAATIKETPPDPAPMLAHFERHFRRLLQRAHEHADRVLVVRQPWFRRTLTADEAACMWHGGVGQAWRGEVDTFYSFEAFNRVMAKVDDRVVTITTELDIETVDLTSTLEQSLDTYYDAIHVTPKGARQVAVAVSAAILGMPQRRSMSAVSFVPAAAPASPSEAETAVAVKSA